MNMKLLLLISTVVISFSSFSQAQDTSDSSNFSQTSEVIQNKLEISIDELNRLREQVVNEKLPLSRKVSELENKLSKVRMDYQETIRTLDTRKLDLINMKSELKVRQDQANYISNLLNDYIRNFESHLHISEVQRYANLLKEARLAPENSNLTELQIYITQADLLFASLERMNQAIGGTSFEGKAVDNAGLVKNGKFVKFGPIALFKANDNSILGTIELRIGSLEPSVVTFGELLDKQAAEKLIADNKGILPFDPTGGNAHVVEETKQTLAEHIAKGGPVMYPILGMAGLALLVALIKWIHLLFMRNPSKKNFDNLLIAVTENDYDKAQSWAEAVGGPAGKMLAKGAEHLNEPTDLIEEVMFETVLSTKLNLQKLLPFISISASSAPLLGLLGTVTGIINTFKLITVFGSSDVKTLSGGISEALITTEFGLIVAIPSLLLYAFLSRKAKSIVDEMEKCAVSFVNQVSKAKLDSKKELVSA